MATKISIMTGEAPTSIIVEQPREPKHTREVGPNSGYDFEVVGPVRISVGYPENVPVEVVEDRGTPAIEQPGVPNPGDQTNQRPTPDGKPHAGQTSETSELQPEPQAVTDARVSGDLPDEEGVDHADDALNDTTRKPRKR